MKIITEPSVEVISTPEFHEHPDYKVPGDGDEITRLGTFASKGCYNSFGREGRACEANQRAILNHKHGSILEHLNIGVWIEGITRALSLELNRHRHFAISQRSTRYTDEEDAAIVLEPMFADLYERLGDAWTLSYYQDWVDLEAPTDEYRALSAHLGSARSDIRSYGVQVRRLMNLNPHDLEGKDLRKWARGKARNSLPHNLETRGTWTTNIRSWRWVLEARSSRYAADEIRRLTVALWEALYEVAPLYFEDFEVGEVVRGIPELVPEHSKV